MQASKELWEHVLFLTKTDKESFEGGLAAWHTKWKDFLNDEKWMQMVRTDTFTKNLEVPTEA